MGTRLWLWSRRFTTAKGWHWKKERACTDKTGHLWAAIFKQDEPEITFVVSEQMPIKGEQTYER